MKTFWKCLCAAAVLLICYACRSGAPVLKGECPTVEPVFQCKLFSAGEGGYDMFAEPALVVPFYAEGNGDWDSFRPSIGPKDEYRMILAFASGYIHGQHSPKRDFVMKKSTDGGQNWGELEKVSRDSVLMLLGPDYAAVTKGVKTLEYLRNGEVSRWQLRLITGQDARIQETPDRGLSWKDITLTDCAKGGDLAIFFDGSVAVAGDQGEGDITFAAYNSGDFIDPMKASPDSVVLLYPEGQDVDCGIVENGVQVTLGPLESNGITGPEVRGLTGNIRNVGDSARLEIFFPQDDKLRNDRMVIICPGGGYSNLSARKEGTSVAQWLNAQGITAAVLIYRMPRRHPAIPLRDAQNAIRYCRHHAGQWGISQIGILGFSAGGHLCGYASTFYEDEITRPDFSIPIYGVMELGLNTGTRKHLVGESEDLAQAYSLPSHVTGDTPRTLLALSADDRTVLYNGAVHYFEALQAAGVESQLMVLPFGGHGWGFIEEEPARFDPLQEYREVFHTAVKTFILQQ